MPITRRNLLRLGLGGGALAALPACAIGEDASTSSAPSSEGSGGTLRIGAVGQASGIVRDPHQTIPNDSDFLLMSLIYDPLTVPGRDPIVAPRFAESWQPDQKVQTWRFKISPQATFHDGTPATAEDAAWSLRRLREIGGESRVPVKSPGDITADGDELVVTASSPNSLLPALVRLNSFTVKAGTKDFEAAIGTGPFVLESFSEGNARLVRNENWHHGAPKLDAIELSRFDSVSALANAALGGQIDFASNVGAIAGRSAEGRSDLTVLSRPNDVAVPVVMRTSDGPFADPRVREAMRLSAQRSQLVELAYSGYGEIANDILGTADPHYDTSIPQRERDLQRAQDLLREAGFDTSATYELFTKAEAVGEVEMAKAFAEQAADIGVTIEVVEQDVNAFYEKSWTLAPLSTTSWGTNDSVVFLASKYMTSQAEYNETGQQDAEFDAAVAKALETADTDEFGAASKRVQQLEYERGGYIVWGVADGIDIATTKVQDLPTLGGYGRMQLESVWVAET